MTRLSQLELLTEAARRVGFAEGLRDAADEVGAWGPAHAHLAILLRDKATRVELAAGQAGEPKEGKEQ